MLGLGDAGVFWAYVLSIAAALLCLIYGIVNWNKGSDTEVKEIEEEEKWEVKETELNESL